MYPAAAMMIVELLNNQSENVCQLCEPTKKNAVAVCANPIMSRLPKRVSRNIAEKKDAIVQR